jgi:hypothetical protein
MGRRSWIIYRMALNHCGTGDSLIHRIGRRLLGTVG